LQILYILLLFMQCEDADERRGHAENAARAAKEEAGALSARIAAAESAATDAKSSAAAARDELDVAQTKVEQMAVEVKRLQAELLQAPKAPLDAGLATARATQLEVCVTSYCQGVSCLCLW
jgi:chromosome segregation ATPase